MYYEILKEMNPRMKLAIADGSLYVLKEIGLEDTEMYQKLIRLDCKNIVRFYDTVAQDGRFYAVEEFINGGSTLRAYMERRGPLSDLETKNIALQICNGLKQVHKLGIVHRDINPNNIMLAADGTVKIIDFGISRTVKRNQSCDTEILGTQGFTAPEQFDAQRTERLTAQAKGVQATLVLGIDESTLGGYTLERAKQAITEFNRKIEQAVVATGPSTQPSSFSM